MKADDSTSKTDVYADALREMTHSYEGLIQDLAILRQLDELDDLKLGTDEVCRRILECIAFGLAVENSSLMLMDEKGQSVELRAACSPLENGAKSFSAGAWRGHRFRPGEGVVGKVLDTMEPVRVDDVADDETFVPADGGVVQVRSLMCFPLCDKGKTVGVVNLSHSRPSFFSLETERTLSLVAERAARILSRHVLHQRLRESEAHYRLVAENAGDGILVIDEHGRTISTNAAVASMSGIPVERFIRGEAEWKSVVHPDDRQRFLAHRANLVDKRVPHIIEYRGVDTHGKVHYFEEHSSPMLGPEGNVTGLVCVIRDVTERKRAEERQRELEAQVQQAQKLESLGVLAGGVAHDFNNLLMGIMGNADLALTHLPIDSPVRARVDQIEKAAQRAAELAREMLAYSGKGKFVVEPVNLSTLVKEMTDLLKASIPKKVVLERDLAPNLPYIEADGTQMRQIVMNLIRNAAEALGDEAGVISVSTGARPCDRAYLDGTYFRDRVGEGRYVYIQVSDSGPGMDAGTLKKIFEPFFTTKFTGRGLGLAGVLGIVRGHNGTLKVDSAPGHGTTFIVLLPCSDAKVLKPKDWSKEVENWRGQGTILLVDDDEIVRDTGKMMLEELGFTVLTARDGGEGIELLQRHADEIAAVMLDLSMPHMSGEETFVRMRNIKTDVRVVLSSGYSEEESTKALRGQGLAGFIPKPYRSETLKAKLREVLDA